MQVEPCPTNEEDDLGQMDSSKWICHHLSMAVESTNSPLPKQYRDVLKLSKEDQGLWKSAMNDEIKSLHERKVWELVDLPKGRHTIKGRWVFAVKSDSRKKARFVAKGFTQIFGIDYEETFSPVARFETFQLLLSLAVLHDWEIEALDVKATYLFGELDEEIYMDQLEGFVVKGSGEKGLSIEEVHLQTETVCPSMEQATAQKSPGDEIYLMQSRPRNLFQDH